MRQDGSLLTLDCDFWHGCARASRIKGVPVEDALAQDPVEAHAVA